MLLLQSKQLLHSLNEKYTWVYVVGGGSVGTFGHLAGPGARYME